MKKKLILLLVTAMLALAFTSKAQTVGEVQPEAAKSWAFKVIQFLETNQELFSTNKSWTFVPYSSYAKGLKDSKGKDASWGGGLAALYPIPVTRFLEAKAGFRAQYFAGEVVIPSVNFQLQGRYQLFTPKAEWSWFTFSGVASPIRGSQNNGDVGALYGVGVSAKYHFTDNFAFGGGVAWETWSNLEVDHVNHFGLSFDLKF